MLNYAKLTIHRYFNNFGKTQKKCYFCGLITITNATRMIAHKKKCIKCPVDIRKKLLSSNSNINVTGKTVFDQSNQIDEGK